MACACACACARSRLANATYAPGAVVLRQGQEMGRFLLGSTVVLLFPKGPLQFDARWAPEGSVRLGEAMASLGGAPTAPR